MKKLEKPIQQTELLLNCFQAMNHFKLIERNRRIAVKKFLRDVKTDVEWEQILKENKLLK